MNQPQTMPTEPPVQLLQQELQRTLRLHKQAAGEFTSMVRELVGILDFVENWLPGLAEPQRAKAEHLRQRLVQALLSHGVRPTAKVGRPLDLRFHEVVDTRIAEGAQPDTIVEVLQSGWEMLSAAIGPATLRQAKVAIAVDATAPRGAQEREHG